MVEIGDKIKTKYGIGIVQSIILSKDNRYVVVAKYNMLIPTIEGDDKIEVLDD